MKKNNITIRDFVDKDLLEVGQVYAKAFNGAIVDENWEPGDASKLLSCMNSHKPNIFLVALDEDKVIAGFFSAIKPYFGENHLCDTDLFVDPEYQNSGIGKKLFVEMLNRGIKDYQVSGFQGISYSKNEFPGSWYSKIGFEPTGWVHRYGKAELMLEKLNKS